MTALRLWTSEIPPQVATKGFLPERSTTTCRHGTVFPLVLVVVALYFTFCLLIDDRFLQAKVFSRVWKTKIDFGPEHSIAPTLCIPAETFGR